MSPTSSPIPDVTEAEKLRGMKWRVAFGALNTGFCVLTVFGFVFPLFLDELGFTKSQIGLAKGMIPLSILIAPIVAPWLARLGYKRAFFSFQFMRNVVLLLLLLTPWILRESGSRTAVACVLGVVFGFALCRALSMTAMHPWTQEMLPNSMRGKVGAMTSIVGTLLTIVLVPVAAWILDTHEGFTGYQIVIGGGIFLGMLSCGTALFWPGGAPHTVSDSLGGFFVELRRPLRDRHFRRFCVGVAFAILGIGLTMSFLALFLREVVGLPRSTIVATQVATYIAILLSSYFWGWAADRFGSKPIMLIGVGGFTVLPLLFWFMPRESAASLPVALLLIGLGAVLRRAWMTGYMREMYVSIVPPRHRAAYMAVLTSWLGVMAGAGPLLAGAALDLSESLQGSFLGVDLNPYAPVYLGTPLILVTGVLLLRQVRSESSVTTTEFARMFLQGNPFTALHWMVRHSFAKDEDTRVAVTQRLGEAKSPLNVDELIEALADPSFNVRYEAIVAMARTHPEQRIVDALIATLEGNEPDLAIAAAWALGRLGDPRAIEPLRRALESDYRLLRTRAARALATFGDSDTAPTIHDRFRQNENIGERIAYASALGRLRYTEALPDLLVLLDTLKSGRSRRETALAVASLVELDLDFVRLWRATRSDAGTALAQAVFPLRRTADASLVMECSDAFAQNRLACGAADLARLLDTVPPGALTEHQTALLRYCRERLTADEPPLDTILLALVLLTHAAGRTA